MFSPTRLMILAGLASFATSGFGGQDTTLTLDGALKQARLKNGTVRAAYLSYLSAKSGTKAAKAGFLPTVTPTATQEFARQENYTGRLRGTANTDDLTSQVVVAWRLLDSGATRLNVAQAAANEDVAEFTSLQTLRRTLFDVHTKFYEALRRQELLKVQNRQVERTQVIFEQTKFRASDPIGDAPRKDIKQAEADVLNAQVSQLSAQTRISTALADLKAVLGAEKGDLPALSGPQTFSFSELNFSLEDALDEAIKNRADLASSRKRVDADAVRLKIFKLDAGLTWSIDANYRRGFTEDASQRSSLAFNVSYPLYDGAKSKENVYAQKLNLEASKATLTQSELDAKAEVEAGYKEYSQNRLRLQAATKALDAAQENYRFALDSQKEGAASLVEVLTAQVTLTTAESNLVEAQYDAVLSEIRLRLALGREMPGEKD